MKYNLRYLKQIHFIEKKTIGDVEKDFTIPNENYKFGKILSYFDNDFVILKNSLMSYIICYFIPFLN